MTTIDAIDCQAFAGGFTYGAVKAGFRLVGKRELPGGFGVASCEANRHLLGDDWVAEVCDHTEWTPYKVPLVFGNPPCSGFSLLSHRDFRGADSSINSCMWALIEFASRCDPDIVIFESVQQAFKQGRELMQQLRLDMEARTGYAYNLFHVLHNAASVGGAAQRRRYFFVISRIPFGIEMPEVDRLPTLMQSIGDLQGLALTWERQTYRRPHSFWERRWTVSKTGAVDGHMNRNSPLLRRALALVDGLDGTWPDGANISDLARTYYAKYNDLPANWPEPMRSKLIGNDFKMGFYQMHKWRGNAPARVVTGAAVDLVIHPTETRTLTNREAARIQGFPDDWKIAPLQSKSGTQMLWGKGIPVQCGEWIASWAKAAIEGEPGTYTGQEVGDREYVIDYTNAWKTAA